MPSHSATLIEAKPSHGGWEIRAQLRCGCEVALMVPADRVVESVDGKQILVGKYPCPNQHPVSG